MTRVVVNAAAILVCLAFGWAPSVSGQERTPPLPDQSPFVDHPAWSNPEGAVSARSFIGMTVQDAAGHDIGTIDDLFMTRDGRISHALVGLGPLASLTGRKVVVPWRDVKTTTVEEHIRKAAPRAETVARLDERTLDQALRFEPGATRH